jgi:hypothetical protein
MRGSLLWLVMGAASVGACVVGTLGGSPAAAQDAPSGRASSVGEETGRDVEIMRRVLVREGLATRAAGVYTGQGGEAVRLFTSMAGGISEAFVVPGQGATFILRTSDCVAPSKGDEVGSSTDKPTAWDEEAAAVDGRNAGLTTSTVRRGGHYDAAKVEALQARVLDVLARNGQKIHGLAGSDRLTVLVVGGGGARSDFVYPTAIGEGKTATVIAAAHGWQAVEARSVLAIHVSVADCQAAANGSLSTEEFRRRATVAAY